MVFGAKALAVVAKRAAAARKSLAMVVCYWKMEEEMRCFRSMCVT